MSGLGQPNTRGRRPCRRVSGANMVSGEILVEICNRLSIHLPENVTHHIFSFFKPWELACAVRHIRSSTRKRKRGISSPYLSFMHTGLIYSCSQDCKHFTTLLHDSLKEHYKRKKPDRLHLSKSCFGYDQGVSTLNLSRGVLKPNSKEYSSLRVLSLSYVSVASVDDIGEWISTYCKSVTKLSLLEVHGNYKFSIKSSVLKDLSIIRSFHKLQSLNIEAENLSNLVISTTSSWHCAKKGIPMPAGYWEERIYVGILTPKLENFTWEGKLLGKFSGSLMSLRNASLFCETHQGNLLEIEDCTMDSLVDIVQLVSKVKLLQLHACVIEDLFLKNRLPILLKRVKKLVVYVKCLRDRLTPAIITFLQGLPKLTTLEIRCKNDCSEIRNPAFGDKLSKWPSEWESENQSFGRLKKVVIEIHEGNDPTELIDYLRVNAKSLEKMTVFYTNTLLKKLANSGFQILDPASSSNAGLYSFKKKF